MPSASNRAARPACPGPGAAGTDGSTFTSIRHRVSGIRHPSSILHPPPSILASLLLLALLLVADMAHAQPPVITRITNHNPSVSIGASVQMQVWVTGVNSAIQWFGRGDLLPGQEGPTLHLPEAQPFHTGFYWVVASNAGGSVTSNPVRLDVDATFTKITTGAMVTDLQRWAGQAWGDYDNDGYPDRIVWSGASIPIYRNNGDGTFTRFDPPGLQGALTNYRWFYNWVDYDNDGWLDLFVPSLVSGIGPNLIFRNDGDGNFTQVSVPPITQEGGVSVVAAWGDYNRDGLLDLVVGNGGAGTTPTNNWFYENRGAGVFVRVANAVTADRGLFGAPFWVDLDGDGRLDLSITALDTNRLFRGLPNGGFLRVTGDPLVSEALNPGGSCWGDYDNDGHLDYFLASAGSSSFLGPVFLYHNDGASHFAKLTTAQVGPLLSERGNARSCAWGDYDNDGWLDLFVGNGYTENSRAKSLLYRNNGNGTFTKITTGSPVNDLAAVSGNSWVDIDRDGFLDLSCTEHDNTGNTPSRLYRNNGNGNNWLCVQCVGTASPRFGTGAKVRVKATLAGVPRWQLRLIDAGGSSWCGSSFVAHFGLGDATVVDTLRIEWTSGIVQEFRNVPVRQYLTVTEPARLAMPQPGVLQIQCWKGMTYQIQGSPDLQTWTPLATVTNANLIGGIQWTDPAVPSQTTRFYRAVKQ